MRRAEPVASPVEQAGLSGARLTTASAAAPHLTDSIRRADDGAHRAAGLTAARSSGSAEQASVKQTNDPINSLWTESAIGRIPETH
ncbi:hypothetical protein Q5P01_022827 [Channa striata]|uniref:Uncharacterized protein n=1 Tax=Channa striata TaxID=64152 RepID=A0AA88LRS9_CHASR|nr:hypothetical protein Q5P01_022827 [Channa striata]